MAADFTRSARAAAASLLLIGAAAPALAQPLGGGLHGGTLEVPVNKSQIVSAVAEAAGKLAQQANLVELVVAVSVAQAIEALGIVGVDVERIVGIQQAAALQKIVVDCFDMLDRLALGSGWPWRGGWRSARWRPGSGSG